MRMSYFLVFFSLPRKEVENSVDATIQILLNTREETKIMKTSEVKDLGISKELERLQEKLSNIIFNLEIRELKEESFPITNKLDLLTRHSRTLHELYTKVTGMTGEACKCDELVRKEFYDFTYHGLRAVHNDLCAAAADLQPLEVTLEKKEKETLQKLLSYQKGRETQVAHLERLWSGLFSPVCNYENIMVNLLTIRFPYNSSLLCNRSHFP